MRVFVYEWVTGGGMLAHACPVEGSLLTEGLAMVRAVGEDLADLPNTRVDLLRDLRLPQLSARGCQLNEVDSAPAHDERFAELCRACDRVLLIAPETDGVLLRAAREAEACGAELISPGSAFVEIAGHKQETSDRLLAVGVPAIGGVVLDGDASLPVEFTYPAVLKPVDGAGSCDTYVVASHRDKPPAYAWPRRLEPYACGAAVSVAVLCGPGGATPLAPCRQRLSTDGRLRYLGGGTPILPGLAERASALAAAAVEALPPCSGYVGVDLVLGDQPDGRGDRVIEVNPRLTTSYVGLRVAAERSLAGAMIDAAAGKPVRVPFSGRPIAFDADGSAAYHDDHPVN